MIKNGVEIESMYGDYSQVRPRALEIGADQIYDAGDFQMTSFGIGNNPKGFHYKNGKGGLGL